MMRISVSSAFSVLCLVLLVPAAPSLAAASSATTSTARRSRMMERLGADAMLIVTSAPVPALLPRRRATSIVRTATCTTSPASRRKRRCWC